MKKIGILILALIILISCCACDVGGKQLEMENNTDYRILVNKGSVFVYEIKDADTGVWYICTGGGITPKLNADGTLYNAKGGEQ